MLPEAWDRLWHSRWLPWLVLLAAAAYTAVVAPMLLDYRRLTLDKVMEVDQQTTRLSAVRVRDALSSFPNALIALARTTDIISDDPTVRSEALRQALPIREGLFDSGIVLLNNFGKVVAVEPPRPEIIGQDWSDRDYFRQLLKSSPNSVVFSNATKDGPAGTEVLVISVPVLDGDGRFLGALAGQLKLSQATISPYYATIVKLRVGHDGTAYVVDANNRILFDSESIQDGLTYTNQALSSSSNPDADQPVLTRDAQGREQLISHAPIPNTPWQLVIEKDWEALAAPTRGQLDMLSVVYGLSALLPAIAVALLMGRRNSRLSDRTYREQEAELAHKIVDTLLPEHAPVLPGWDIIMHREPAPTVGGSFHDIMLRDDGSLMLALGEVNAVDTPIALTIATVRTTLRTAARSLLSPAQALENSNELLCPDLPPGSSASCLYCTLEPSAGAVRLANAGHQRPLLLSGGGIQPVGDPGQPLALQLDSRYDEAELELAPCEALIFYSSGVLDALSPGGEQFGLTRLQQAVTAAPSDGGALVRAIVTALREFTGNDWTPERDATLVVLFRCKRLAAG